MNPLPLIIRKNGFTYTQILREGRSCIYEQRVTEELSYFEIFTVKIKPTTIIHGKILHEREVFPGNNDFGKTAWSCRTLEDAMIRFEKLIKQQTHYTNSIQNNINNIKTKKR